MRDMVCERPRGSWHAPHGHARTPVPVIITIGHRDDEIDPVAGLLLGADDYVTTGASGACPRGAAYAGRRAPRRDRCRFGGWHLDSNSRRLTNPNGSLVGLTKGEHALLIAFLDAPQRRLTREPLRQIPTHSDTN